MDTRSARVNPGIAKKCGFNFDEKQMMEMHEDIEKNLDLNQILNAKSAKGGNPSPVIQGKCFKKHLDKFFTWEAMIADTGCSYNICSEKICGRIKIENISIQTRYVNYRRIREPIVIIWICLFICQNTGPGTQQNKEVGSGCTERELFGSGNSA